MNPGPYRCLACASGWCEEAPATLPFRAGAGVETHHGTASWGRLRLTSNVLVWIGRAHQQVGRRSPQRDIKLELSLVVVENRVQIFEPRAGQESQRIDHFQRQA